MAPLALDLDAENGPGDVTITPAGTTLITTAMAAHGSASYQFTSVPAETMTLNAAFVPAAGSSARVQFPARFRQHHRDGPRADFHRRRRHLDRPVHPQRRGHRRRRRKPPSSAHSIDLSAYAGQTCKVRFTYSAASTGVYFPRGDGTGWFVDDITVSGAQTMAAPTVADVAAGALQFTFTPPAAGQYALEVEPVFYGQYAADAGPALAVSAVGTGAGTGPAVTVSATTPQAHTADGSSGVFTLTRTGGDPSQKIVVHYVLKGSAVNGVDYAQLSGKAKIKPGRTSATVSVVPLSGTGTGGTSKVKLVLEAGDGYGVGAPSVAAVKIKP